MTCKPEIDKQRPGTIVDVCHARRWPLPVSHDDIRDFVMRCDAVGQRCNFDDEPIWRSLLEEGRALEPDGAMRAGDWPYDERDERRSDRP